MTARDHVRRRMLLMNTCIDTLSWDAMLGRVARWARQRESRYICFCNVHSLVTGRSDPAFRKAVLDADTAAPDGMPVAWLMRRRGVLMQERIDGPGLMWRYAEQAALDGTPIYLYGSTETTLRKLMERLRYSFPGLVIAGHYAPPFRALEAHEEQSVVDGIVESRARVVFIGLGCPRQELWMAKISPQIPAVLLGVGAAFDYHAGTLKRAPVWMQKIGLEWLYRLMAEPRRLWRRYLVTNALFIAYALRDSLTWRRRTTLGDSQSSS